MSKQNILKDGFTAEDFDRLGFLSNEIEGICIRCNAILSQALKDAVRVYGYVGTEGSSWSSYPPGTFIQENNTHTGLLINIEKIGAKDGE